MRRSVIVVWLALSVGAVLALQTLPLPAPNRLWREIQNAGHAPLFGVFSLGVLAASRGLAQTRTGSALRQYLTALVAAVLAGALAEALQFIGPREPDLRDFAYDCLGVVSFLGVYSAWDPQCILLWSAGLRTPAERRVGRHVRFTVVATGVLLLSAVFVRPAMWTLAYHYREQAFPSICDFETRWCGMFLVAYDSDLRATSPPPEWKSALDSQVGKLILRAAPYSGFRIEEPYPDWRGRNSLNFDVFSRLADSVLLTVRIDDCRHNQRYDDRFNRQLVVRPGLNRFQIPLADVRTAPATREMDMSAIAALWLFAVQPSGPITLFIDDIRLE